MTRIAQLAELLVVLEQENQKLSNENSYLSEDFQKSLDRLDRRLVIDDETEEEMEKREREYHEGWAKIIRAAKAREAAAQDGWETESSEDEDVVEAYDWEDEEEDPSEFYDIAFTHLKPKLLPSRFYFILENISLNESGVFYELNRSFNISQLRSFCQLLGYDVLKMPKARLINFLLDIHHYNEKNTRIMNFWHIPSRVSFN